MRKSDGTDCSLVAEIRANKVCFPKDVAELICVL